MPDFVTPPPVERGDSVAVVAPASNVAEEFSHVYDLGLSRMREVFDLDPVEYPTATADPDWLLENPEARAQDVMDAFEDPDISAVIATIGGNDQLRILKHLDPDVLRENPTRFYGWSDNTNLALFLWNQGIVSYYGGSTLTEYAMDAEMFEYTVEYLGRALFDEHIGEWEEADCFTDQPGDWGEPRSLQYHRDIEPADGRTWVGGEKAAEGRIWGGCFEILDQWFIHDEWLPAPAELEGTILALETSEEVPDPGLVTGWLRGLGEAGYLEVFDGFLVGRACARNHTEAGDNPAHEREAYREQQREAFETVIPRYNPDAPIVLDCEFGHTYPTCPLPIGGVAELDPGSETIALR
ncbi:S66 family peptidase [Haloarchaeobius sp. DYHT-AS-18]|uniref:S66 family peptidase n=1 Tax=Haloarchaeobius sp. DYHT-AS-18 TaxID=3446117 RepID=UPI003EB9822C